MNVRRGVIRLFVVLTLLWVVPVAWIMTVNIAVIGDDARVAQMGQELAEVRSMCNDLDALPVGGLRKRWCELRIRALDYTPRAGVAWSAIPTAAAIVLVPPAVAWCFLSVTFWICSGFLATPVKAGRQASTLSGVEMDVPRRRRKS